MTTGFKRLRVDTYDSDDRDEERKAMEERVRQHREERAKGDAGT
jgi:hypothetical protein